MNQTSMPHEGGWKAKAAEWLFSQGVSTVLLALILFGIYRVTNYAIEYAVPAHLQKIQEGYSEIQQANKLQVEWLASTFERERIAERERSEESIEAMRELTQAIKSANK